MALAESARQNLCIFGRKWRATATADQDAVLVPEEVLCKPMKDLGCNICLEYPMTPWQLSCEHTFCFACLQGHKDSGRSAAVTCPVCRQPTMATMTKSRMLRTLIHDTTFRCHQPDCDWVGAPFTAAKNHWSSCALSTALDNVAGKERIINSLRDDVKSARRAEELANANAYRAVRTGDVRLVEERQKFKREQSELLDEFFTCNQHSLESARKLRRLEYQWDELKSDKFRSEKLLQNRLNEALRREQVAAAAGRAAQRAMHQAQEAEQNAVGRLLNAQQVLNHVFAAAAATPGVTVFGTAVPVFAATPGVTALGTDVSNSSSQITKATNAAGKAGARFTVTPGGTIFPSTAPWHTAPARPWTYMPTAQAPAEPSYTPTTITAQAPAEPSYTPTTIAVQAPVEQPDAGDSWSILDVVEDTGEEAWSFEAVSDVTMSESAGEEADRDYSVAPESESEGDVE